MLRKLILEIHRRSLWQVLTIYAVGSWVAFEVISELSDVVGLPAWVPAFAIVLFLLGLPVVLATAFVQEGMPGQRTPEGMAPAVDPTLLPSLSDARSETDRRSTPEGALTTGPRASLMLTWRRSLLSGIVAFLLLGLTAGGYMGMRNAGVGPFGSLVASGALAERAPVLLAGFDDVSGDTLLADALAAAFRIDFAETGIVTVVDERQVSAALKRMGRGEGERLTEQLALEIAARENIPAVIVGEVRSAAGSTLLTVALLNTADGAPLVSYRETATDSSDILPALDRLSKQLRGKLGESLRTVRAGKPLAQVTTPSLEALRRYSRGVEALDVQRDFPLAITLLKEAVALDSTFAMAWRKLGVAYLNMGDAQSLGIDAVTRAYRFSERLPDSERYQAVGFYHMYVTGDVGQGLASYRAGIDAFPEKNRASFNNLAVGYMRLRDWPNAEAAARQTIAADSMLVVGYVNLIVVQVTQGKLDAADSTLALFIQRHGARTPDAVRLSVLLDAVRGDYASADSAVQALLEFAPAQARGSAHYAANLLAVIEGRLQAADRHRREAVAARLAQGVTNAWLNDALMRAWTELLVRLDSAAAITHLTQALEANDLEALPPRDREWFQLIAFYSFTGDAARARALLAEYERLIPEGQRGFVRQELLFARAQIAFAEGRAEEALELARSGDRVGGCTFCGPFELSYMFDMLGQADSAAVYYERYLATPDLYRFELDALALPRIHERLAEIYDATGDTNRALLHAARFTELWKDVDAELQPRVRAKQAMVARLTEG